MKKTTQTRSTHSIPKSSESFGRQLQADIDQAEQSAAYQNYRFVRDKVIQMINEAPTTASRYWSEELAGFDYLFNASPLIVNKLREHCYHITGIKSYEYRQHHRYRAQAFEDKLALLKAIDKTGLFIEELPLMGGFGHQLKEGRVNLDTLKFYEAFIALDKSGVLATLKEKKRPVIIEIGSGWGGFAYQLKTLLPDACVVLVDLPQTMIFSGTYLKTAFPNAKHCFEDELKSERDLVRATTHQDFIYLSPEYFGKLTKMPIDAALNMISFQEMTAKQVGGYVRQLAKLKCPILYSYNRDIPNNNQELSKVSDLLEKNYRIEEITVLKNRQYTDLVFKGKNQSLVGKAKWAAYEVFRRVVMPSPFRYRHLVGRLAAKSDA